MPGPIFLDGDGVALHTIEEADIPFLQETINDPTVRRYVSRFEPINGHQEREWFEEQVSSDDETNLLVVTDDGPVGTVGLTPDPQLLGSAEIGIVLAKSHWNEGYGTEASRLLTDYAFRERRIHRVVARVLDPNEGSKRIWEKLGFRHEAVHREATFVEGEYVDVHDYAVLRSEWRE
ncbi:Acetyltransferase, RimL family [Halanaeroarchaeum sp. HSR-CO]|uniref:GNAT family N-acetyltransferase n=1 Tax=Halanaeroarchaeum sp. HSR-CO TaxID=2866382 RepID=UPI00217DB3B3|nr:GNAT family protein [Halanaeroarchaeum sp. HSR-CO]UWG48909.1 Acetyltransferase, RimL family [Halanaeroarchaeum sp. HSR-CO]